MSILENIESYVEGLKAELRGAVQAKNKDHAAAVKAELDRVSAPAVEKAVAPAAPETAAK